jgi:hypothetical protein
MGRLGKISVGIGLACVVFSATALAAPKPPPIDVARGDDHVTGTQGSYCWTDDQGGTGGVTQCSDFAYPLPVRCTLKLKRGTKLTIDAGLPAQVVFARLMGAEPGSKSRKLHGIGDANVSGSQRWRFKVPRVPDGAAILDVSVRYTQGDANVWIGLKNRACRDADLPKP